MDGVSTADKYINENLPWELAKKGDTVLLTGKSHEQSMNYTGKEEPWSEHEAVEQALKLKVKS